MRKNDRQKAILEIVKERPVPSQEALRTRLRRRGFAVAQATLSRDVRELGLVKRTDPEGRARYETPGDDPHVPALQRLLPDLFLRAEGTGHLLLVRTRVGGAQPVAAALDGEEWPEVLGTLAGDDTILVILRRPRDLRPVQSRIEKIAGAG